jgi:hypothetical protein
MQRVMRVDDDPNRWVLRNYACGIALSVTGDDFHLSEMQKWSRKSDLPPNVRHWSLKIIKALEDNWKKTTKEWPEPWFAWRGRIERLSGELQSGGDVQPAEFTLWLEPPDDQDVFVRWGGVAVVKEGAMHLFFRSLSGTLTKTSIRLEGRSIAEADIVGSSGNLVTLSGIGAYPEPLKSGLE